jgi:hypothetical protein
MITRKLRGLVRGPSTALLFLSIFATATNAQTLDELREQYPWGAIYVTNSALLDLYYLANSSLASLPDHSVGFPHLLAFIERVGGHDISGHIAFLHVDLRDLRAGYTSPWSSQGVLTPLPWSQREVFDAARWLDTYFKQNSHAMMRVASLDDAPGAPPNAVAVREALTAVQEAADDPFISPVRAFQLASEFRVWAGANEEAIASLRDVEPTLVREVSEFQARYDRAYFSTDLPEGLSPNLRPRIDADSRELMWRQPIDVGPRLTEEVRDVERTIRQLEPR